MRSVTLARAEPDWEHCVVTTVSVTVSVGPRVVYSPCTAAAPIDQYEVHAERIGIASSLVVVPRAPKANIVSHCQPTTVNTGY
jgi:hypothetical protein